MRDHTGLIAFNRADELVIAVYKVTKYFPKEELFGLTSQMRRAAVSVASNIVEGCARSTDAEYLRFLVIAFSSAKELDYQLSVARRLEYFPSGAPRGGPLATIAQEVLALSEETVKVLAGLVKSRQDTG